MKYFSGVVHTDGNQALLKVHKSTIYENCLNFNINKSSTVMVGKKEIEGLVNYLQNWMDTGSFEGKKENDNDR